MRIDIIGAGPVGSYTAHLLTKQGHSVHLHEEHSTIGSPIQCTGLLTNSIHTVLKPSSNYITNITEGVDVIAPNGKILSFKAKEYLVHRTKFDQHLAFRAQDAGATIYTNHHFVDKRNNKIIIKDKKENKTKEITTDILIGADGANSTVAKLINPNKKRKYYVGVQARVSGKFNPKKFTVYFNNTISPGFFAWIVPENETIARVGLKGTAARFNTFIKRHNFKKIEMQAGPIPIYDRHYRTEHNNMYLVGDAATQVKATTAGGIIPGMKAAQCLASAIKNNDSYHKLWKKSVGRNLWLHSKIRYVMDRFTDSDWNRFISLLDQQRVKKTFEQYDREKPFKLLTALLKEPRLCSFSKYLLS